MTLRYPLEREYEGWTMDALERALQCVGAVVSISAVSPKHESTWPADEELRFADKVVGLQFKRAHPRINDGVERCAWSLRSKSDQLKKIKKLPQIYYAPLRAYVGETLHPE